MNTTWSESVPPGTKVAGTSGGICMMNVVAKIVSTCMKSHPSN